MSAGRTLDALEKPSPIEEVEWALERAEASPYPLGYWMRQARARRGIGLGATPSEPARPAAPRPICSVCGADIMTGHKKRCPRHFDKRPRKTAKKE